MLVSRIMSAPVPQNNPGQLSVVLTDLLSISVFKWFTADDLEHDILSLFSHSSCLRKPEVTAGQRPSTITASGQRL